MRVISLVPSWTETLVEASVEVVGRTRFCIHPSEKIKSIPIVGGTKDINWDAVYALNADLIILDREENPEAIANECKIPFIDTHVTSIESLAYDFKKLSEELKNPTLLNHSKRVEQILQMGPLKWQQDRIPDLQEWVVKPYRHFSHVSYMIWAKPWMCVAPETYIGSVLKQLGASVKVFNDGLRYPTVDLDSIRDTLVLFSSEPYPFHKKIEPLKNLGLKGAIVNGESYSWFGIRGLQFLEKTYQAAKEH